MFAIHKSDYQSEVTSTCWWWWLGGVQYSNSQTGQMERFNESDRDSVPPTHCAASATPVGISSMQPSAAWLFVGVACVWLNTLDVQCGQIKKSKQWAVKEKNGRLWGLLKGDKQRETKRGLG